VQIITWSQHTGQSAEVQKRKYTISGSTIVKIPDSGLELPCGGWDKVDHGRDSVEEA
jgi:hypothetical protein